ncbi:MAG: hypothetical protein JO033_26985 [Acidobacteriaceae bacterium]|nr:hypothetical protein [Acidobacteriaceae bacterium]MBV9502941.1 hypothetical protein [Acidobacteriaceae bacterium]
MQKSDLNKKREFIVQLANDRIAKGQPPMPVEDLATKLNQAGHKTGDGLPFVGDRGTHRLLEATVRWLRSENRHAEAENIWKAFEHPRKSSKKI